MQAVIMAGGKGTRLSSVTHDLIPKPLVMINKRSLIDYLVDCVRDNGIEDLFIIVGHLGEQIEQHLGDGKDYGINIRYIYEKEPLGTAGGLFYLKDLIHDDFVMIYGDVLVDMDIRRMHAFHKAHLAEATLLVHPNSHPFDSDLVMCNPDGLVIGFDYKDNVRDYDYDNLVNAGVFIFSPLFLNRFTGPKKQALEKNVLKEMVLEGGRVFAYPSPEYAKDVGTPERLTTAETELLEVIVKDKNLFQKQKCVFLDRDGTINLYKGLITDPNQIELFPDAAKAIRLLNQNGYLTIVITNQPVIARGDCTLETLTKIHRRLITLLGREGAFVDDLLFCPHHPDKGYEGEVLELKINCDCRKPKIGMIVKSVQKFNINLGKSWVIGDTYRDVQTGTNAGTRTILLSCGAEQENIDYTGKPTYLAESLLDAVKIILREE